MTANYHLMTHCLFNENILHFLKSKFLLLVNFIYIYRRNLVNFVKSAFESGLRFFLITLYKRPNDKEWHGPGVIVGIDGTVTLVRHGGSYVRVNPCNLTKINQDHEESSTTANRDLNSSTSTSTHTNQQEVDMSNIYITVDLMHWIAIFGKPDALFSDNGGKFNNSILRDVAELLDCKVMTTAAYSPWSNGIVERHNAVIENMILKISHDT